uniref:Uncharacterized protein n=1 Tax=Cacopsylla melanoneura TaxID=428564 RepID=A0A8D8LWH7_9HEMI
MYRGQHGNPGHTLQHPRHRTPGASNGGVAHVDVPLHREGQCQPDRSRMEQGRYHLIHNIPRIAGRHRGQRLVVVTKRIHVEQPGCRKQQGEHITERHSHEDSIGGCPHVTLG